MNRHGSGNLPATPPGRSLDIDLYFVTQEDGKAGSIEGRHIYLQTDRKGELRRGGNEIGFFDPEGPQKSSVKGNPGIQFLKGKPIGVGIVTDQIGRYPTGGKSGFSCLPVRHPNET